MTSIDARPAEVTLFVAYAGWFSSAITPAAMAIIGEGTAAIRVFYGGHPCRQCRRPRGQTRPRLPGSSAFSGIVAWLWIRWASGRSCTVRFTAPLSPS
ncbi:MAG: hypothetical protein ACRDRX_11140 [Pseudonocardiaceae bacterium]